MKTHYGLPYFEQINARPGLNKLKHNTCRIIGLELLVLKAGENYEFSTAGREFGLNMMTGTADFSVEGKTFDGIGQRTCIFDGKPEMVYAGRDSRVKIATVTDCEVALASSLADEKIEPYEIRADQVASGSWGEGNTLRHYNYLLGPDAKSSRLWLAEVCVQDGRWAT